MLGVGANIIECAGVAIVGVDTADLSSIASCGAFDVYVALALAGALFEKGQQLQVSSDMLISWECGVRNGLLTFPHDQ